MKKLLFLIALIIVSYNFQAQVVLTVQSPSNLAGNYVITYTDISWGAPDLLDPLNSLTDTLAFVDDGTSADSLGCNTLINPTQLAGKIAVVYRGSCEFGTKALMAENAGAVAVIIINNIPGSPVGMGAGTDGGSVTIPVIMITQIDGILLRNSFDAGNDIVAFIGNKLGLFNTDMRISKDRILLPNANTNNSLLAQNGTEFSFRLGAWVYNDGLLDQTNGYLKAEVAYNGAVIFSNTIPSIDILSADSMYIELPIFSRPTYPSGKYTLTYTLSTDPNFPDEYDFDNIYVVDFFISDNIFSYVKIDTDGLPIASTGYRATDATTTFSSCIHFRDANASRAKAEGLYFSASTNANTDLINQQLIISAYRIDDVFGDLNDLDLNVSGTGLVDLFEITTGSYTYIEDSMDFVTVYAPFSENAFLEDNKRYMFCVSTFDDNTYLGYGDLDYSWVIDTVLQPLFPIQSDNTWDILGFGGESAAIGVKLSPNNADLAENQKTLISVFPNPSSTTIKINGVDISNFNNVDLKDQLGRTIKTWKINSSEFNIDISTFETGNYFLQFNGNNGNQITKIQILK